MKTKDVRVGGVYAVKVSERVVPVEIVRELRPRYSFDGHQGPVRFQGRNLGTGRDVQVTAGRCRYELESFVKEGKRYWRRKETEVLPTS